MPEQYPDATGHYGEFGGRYVPETLMQALIDLEAAYITLKDDAKFQNELNDLLRTIFGTETLQGRRRKGQGLSEARRPVPYRGA